MAAIVSFFLLGIIFYYCIAPVLYTSKDEEPLVGADSYEITFGGYDAESGGAGGTIALPSISDHINSRNSGDAGGSEVEESEEESEEDSEEDSEDEEEEEEDEEEDALLSTDDVNVELSS